MLKNIESEFDRIFANQVDESTVEWGMGTMSGYVAKIYEERVVVGWYADGGSVGHPVLSIPVSESKLACDLLCQIPEGVSIYEVAAHLVYSGISCEVLV